MTLPSRGHALLALVVLFLVGLALPQAAPAQGDKLLKVTEAFQLNASAQEPGSIALHWDIAPDYYLYQGRISAKAVGPDIELGELQLPPGEQEHDQFLGDVVIYHNSVDASLPYTLAAGHQGPVKIAVKFQGCHEVAPKICYPPHTETLTLEVPPPPAQAPAASGAPEPSGKAAGEGSQPGAPAASSTPAGGLLGALGQLGGATPAGPANGAPLPPDEAFQFQAIAAGPDKILARFTMAEDYYLYRDRSHIQLAHGENESNGVTLGTPQWPQGVMHKDATFGETEVYFTEVDVPIAVQRSAAAAQPVTLEAVFQGCQVGGICYPPITQDVTLTLPARPAAAAGAAPGASASAAATASTSSAPNQLAGTPEKPANPAAADAGVTAQAGAQATPATSTSNSTAAQGVGAAGGAAAQPESEQQRLAGSLAGSGRWLALLLFFGFGILLAFTPCILPMIPILSGLIAGAGENLSTRRAFLLSVVYVVANAVVFTVVGVVAGLVGSNLQAAFQTPWVLWLFAAVFVALALSMFGFYELQLPTSLQNRLTRASNKQKSGSVIGVAIMGLLSAFIVGPCVAPPLAGAVLYIAEQQDPVFGGLALFLLGLGMGVPLVIFGTLAGRFVPRAGAWMNAVKAVFGVVFLGLAIWMLSRILDPVWIMAMTGVLLMVCGVYMGALERIKQGASGWRTLWKALGLVVLLVGAAELVGTLGGSRDVLQPLAGMTASSAQQTTQKLQFQPVTSVADLQQSLARAKQAGKPVMFEFYADWCVSCKEMQRFTYSQPQVQQALSGFVLLKADVTAYDADDKALLQHFNLYGPPATMFYAPDGDELRGLRLVGFENAADFTQRINQVAEQE